MKVLLLSGYEAESHRYWAEQLRNRFADIEWVYLALPPRHFSWRCRGSSFSLLNEYPQNLNDHYDLVIATSMVDVASLKGMCPNLCSIPWHLYVHENQFAYPDLRAESRIVDIQLTTVYSALAASKVFFNSDFNRASFLSGAINLFKKFPDFNHLAVIRSIEDKSIVLPVPLSSNTTTQGPKQGDVIWNHRWEYDKGPDRLFAFARAFCQLNSEAKLHVVGQQFRKFPDIFLKLEAMLNKAGKLGYFGYIEDRAVYESLLSASEFVLSTSLHDFQGLSVLEACQQGAKPLVPNRLVYPEWFAGNCYESHKDIDREAESAIDLYLSGGSSADVSLFSSEALINRYRSELLSI